MSKFCGYCGADITDIVEDGGCICRYCRNDISHILKEDDEKQQKLMDAALKRNEGDFQLAKECYKEILASDPENFMARWGTYLCEWRVVYVETEDEEERVITCREKLPVDFRKKFMEKDDYFIDIDFQLAFNKATEQERAQFKKDIDQITKIQKRIHELEDKSVDIFICYKETDDKNKGRRTIDSVQSDILYTELSYEGYNVFFARKSLKDKLGADYEAEIFNAISKAKVMLLVCSQERYFHSPWVKNEWSRFLEEMEKDKEKKLIILYQSLNTSQFPEKISKLQSISLDEDCHNDYAQLKLNLHKTFAMHPKTDNIFPALKTDDSALEAIIAIEDSNATDKYEKTLQNLKTEAAKANPEACFLLGSIYYKDYYKDRENEDAAINAFNWFMKAAEHDHPDAIFQLAFMYEFGIGTKKDKVQAEIYYARLDKLCKNYYPLPID